MRCEFLVNLLSFDLFHQAVVKQNCIHYFGHLHALIARAQQHSPVAKIFYLTPVLMQRKAYKSQHLDKGFNNVKDWLVCERCFFLSQHRKCH